MDLRCGVGIWISSKNLTELVPLEFLFKHDSLAYGLKFSVLQVKTPV